MRPIKISLVTALCWSCLSALAAAGNLSVDTEPALADDAPLIIRFEANTSQLDTAAKVILRRTFDGFRPQPAERILVVGYTDSLGRSQKNLDLSLDRANAVRDELIKVLGIAPSTVLALGRGEQEPEDNNKDAEGRSRNRRVEIYLARKANSRMLEAIKSRELPLEKIEPLIQEARDLIRQRDLAPAFRNLNQAKTMGADQLSDWHAVYAMAGYYAGIDVEKIRTHLTRSLTLDAYNAEARAYLGRLEARRKIKQGQMPPATGTTLETAIAVSHREEIYEYLKLLNIEPRSHSTVTQQPIEAWTGVDSDGKEFNCYFNLSQTLTWAFDQ